MSSLISQDGVNQLNIFIFVLAVMQIVYCVLTMALGRAKVQDSPSWYHYLFINWSIIINIQFIFKDYIFIFLV